MRECGTMRATVRQYTHTGRPLGSEEFVAKPGTFHSAGAGSAEGRQAHEARAGCQAGWLYLRCLDRMGNVPPALRFLNSRRKRREISMAKLSCSHMGRRNGATPVCPRIPRSFLLPPVMQEAIRAFRDFRRPPT